MHAADVRVYVQTLYRCFCCSGSSRMLGVVALVGLSGACIPACSADAMHNILGNCMPADSAAHHRPLSHSTSALCKFVNRRTPVKSRPVGHSASALIFLPPCACQLCSQRAAVPVPSLHRPQQCTTPSLQPAHSIPGPGASSSAVTRPLAGSMLRGVSSAHAAESWSPLGQGWAPANHRIGHKGWWVSTGSCYMNSTG